MKNVAVVALALLESTCGAFSVPMAPQAVQTRSAGIFATASLEKPTGSCEHRQMPSDVVESCACPMPSTVLLGFFLYRSRVLH